MRVARLSIGVVLLGVSAGRLTTPGPALAVLIVALILVPCTTRCEGLPFERLDRGLRIDLAWLMLLLAVPLVPAYTLEPGALAGLLVLPWLVGCSALAVIALVEGIKALPSILRLERAQDLLGYASLALLAVGAGFVALERLAISPFGLDQSIVLITAVHFHVLGFGLISVAAALAGRSQMAKTAAYPFLVGIPTTAAGFTLDSTAIQWVGAVLVASGALYIVVSLVGSSGTQPLWRRAAFLLAAVTLAVGVPMGALWATALHFGLPFISFGAMVAVHGALNMVGTGVALLALPERPL